VIKKFALALKVIKVLLAIVPLVRKVIEQVEIPGNGPEKKAAVLAALGNTIDALPWEISPEVKETALRIIGGLIDVIIGILNLVGHDWSKTL
jgi:hypothetical protein